MKTPKTLDQAITDKAMRLYDEVGPDKARKQMKKDFENYKKKKGYEHKADPLHPMNRETMVGKKKGGKIGQSGHNRLY